MKDDDDAKSKIITDKLSKLTANITKNLLSAQDNVHRSFLVNERDLLSICQLGKKLKTDQPIDRIHGYPPAACGWTGNSNRKPLK